MGTILKKNAMDWGKNTYANCEELFITGNVNLSFIVRRPRTEYWHISYLGNRIWIHQPRSNNAWLKDRMTYEYGVRTEMLRRICPERNLINRGSHWGTNYTHPSVHMMRPVSSCPKFLEPSLMVHGSVRIIITRAQFDEKTEDPKHRSS